MYSLSTPHGTLGTRKVRLLYAKKRKLLSTPHGTLGTDWSITTLREFSRLSTPHGTLGTPLSACYSDFGFSLSTPHGTLGTQSLPDLKPVAVFDAFNSTRYIRNILGALLRMFLMMTLLSTPHGTLGTKN